MQSPLFPAIVSTDSLGENKTSSESILKKELDTYASLTGQTLSNLIALS